jgi:hypothetical protein
VGIRHRGTSLIRNSTPPLGHHKDRDPVASSHWISTLTLPFGGYRGTSLKKKRLPLGPYHRHMPRALWWFWGDVIFLMSGVTL